MGSVFLAQQTEPVKRAVAVKVIKAGMDSKAVLARFEAERQALALMDHPHIAKVLDAGTTEGGRPFFVMELVKGTPITEFCDARKLTPKERLELFVPVCQAVQHAHQKGVIHRDLKPSNVLVAMYDDRPVPKVIDFGVAKAAGQSLTDKTLLTGFGAVIGTPEYMSPEQANLNNLDVDTRSDVYSLGVLLYELLTGTTPVNRKSLGKAALLEVLRVVREVETPRPSARLSTSDALPSIAANRGTEPARLSRLMKGELDWIVLKALEKDRTRRYDTANGLAADLRRYLSGEPVQAVPPSAAYRMAKFCRRNRTALTVTGVVLVAVGAAAVLGVGLLLGKLREQQLALTVLDERQQQALKDQARHNLSEIKRRMESGRSVRALRLAQETDRALAGDPTLSELLQRLTVTGTLRVEPAGARVAVKDWNEPDDDWLEVGSSPLVNVRLPKGPLRWQFSKPGHVTVEKQYNFPDLCRVEVHLPREADAPPGMVLIPGGAVTDFQGRRVLVGPFAIDRHEVTCREFARFVDAAGYGNESYWQHPFVHGGRPISRADAMKLFVDQTGKAGPATWSGGTFPAGEADFPVRGVCWYEAAAYAAFAGKHLPTTHHWQRASAGDPEYCIPLSNFSGRGPARAGAFSGIGEFGVYDMAGNVKEWCSSETGKHLRILRGGAWTEPGYLFGHPDTDVPTSRKPTHGFRCVKYFQPPSAEAVAPVGYLLRSFESETPATPQELAGYVAQYEYDASAALNAQTVSPDQHPEWRDCRHELVSIDAAYGGERLDLHLFWPRNAEPPLETVVWYPGNVAFFVKDMDAYLNDVDGQYCLSLVATGRAVCMPVYKGTLGRRYPSGVVFNLPPVQYRDSMILATKDMRRAIDYLHTRKEVDHERLIFVGLSQGALRAPALLVVEPRFRAAVLLFGGYWKGGPMRPEVEPHQFAPHVRAPVLMVNGALDDITPFEPYQRKFFQDLGSKDKQYLPFDNCGHVVPIELAVPAVDRWLRDRLRAR
jgi:formylglycine-generating enzyme required for sulfatase activity/predicted esterase